MNQEATPSVDNLLASLLADFGKKPAREKKKALPKNAKPLNLPLPEAWNLRKTGYKVWQATGRAIQIQEQHCACCGAVTKAVKNELYILENSASHSVWMRVEGFGIDNQQDLPITYVDVEPITVSACAECRLPQVEEAILAMVQASQQLTFPF